MELQLLEEAMELYLNEQLDTLSLNGILEMIQKIII